MKAESEEAVAVCVLNVDSWEAGDGGPCRSIALHPVPQRTQGTASPCSLSAHSTQPHSREVCVFASAPAM